MEGQYWETWGRFSGEERDGVPPAIPDPYLLTFQGPTEWICEVNRVFEEVYAGLVEETGSTTRTARKDCWILAAALAYSVHARLKKVNPPLWREVERGAARRKLRFRMPGGWAARRDLKRQKKKLALGGMICRVCGDDISYRRRGARTCSPACRKALSRKQ